MLVIGGVEIFSPFYPLSKFQPERDILKFQLSFEGLNRFPLRRNVFKMNAPRKCQFRENEISRSWSIFVPAKKTDVKLKWKIEIGKKISNTRLLDHSYSPSINLQNRWFFFKIPTFFQTVVILRIYTRRVRVIERSHVRYDSSRACSTNINFWMLVIRVPTSRQRTWDLSITLTYPT